MQGAPPGLAEPGGQAVHALENTDENDPGGQAEHTDEPASAYEPERDNTEVKWFSKNLQKIYITAYMKATTR